MAGMELLRRFVEGDTDAFETIFRQHQSEVHRWLVRMVRDATIAEALVVETFWRIYRSRATFDWKRSFEAWARRIATNVARDALRRRPVRAARAASASASSLRARANETASAPGKPSRMTTHPRERCVAMPNKLERR
jgi:RNA polymerase sigma-70 factor (ECF subfamily)